VHVGKSQTKTVLINPGELDSNVELDVLGLSLDDSKMVLGRLEDLHLSRAARAFRIRSTIAEAVLAGSYRLPCMSLTYYWWDDFE